MAPKRCPLNPPACWGWWACSWRTAYGGHAQHLPTVSNRPTRKMRKYASKWLDMGSSANGCKWPVQSSNSRVAIGNQPETPSSSTQAWKVQTMCVWQSACGHSGLLNCELHIIISGRNPAVPQITPSHLRIFNSSPLSSSSPSSPSSSSSSSR